MGFMKTDDIDHDLITRFESGSPQAMEDIVERYEGPIFNFLLRMCGHVQDAEDVMQETFLSALFFKKNQIGIRYFFDKKRAGKNTGPQGY